MQSRSADEDPRFGAPILAELHADLTGWAIGDVPPGVGSPPLVEAARAVARRLGFSLASVAMADDPDLGRVSSALGELSLSWRARGVLGLTGNPDIAALLAPCFRRSCYLAAYVARAPADRAREMVAALNRSGLPIG